MLWEFEIFGHMIAFGLNWDYTLILHFLTGAVLALFMSWLLAVRINQVWFPMRRGWLFFGYEGAIGSIVAAFYLEFSQMWQYHWKVCVSNDPCGMFGIGDLLASIAGACLMAVGLHYAMFRFEMK